MNIFYVRLCAALLAVCTAGTVGAQAPDMLAAVQDGDRPVVKSFPRPTPAAGQVLIKVRAVSANPVDWRARPAGGREGGPRMGGSPGGPPAGGPPGGGPPSLSSVSTNPNGVLGYDAAGVIAGVGLGVSGWKVGDEVIAFLESRGAYAEYAIATSTQIAAKPKRLSFEQAAGIPTVAYAAYAVLVDVAQVQAGQRVLVHGAAGGVGSAAVQIARARGATVIGTASKRNHEYLKSIGVSQSIDYTTEKFEDKVRDLDIVMNTANADTATRSIPLVKKGGYIVSVAGQADSALCTAAGITCSGRRFQGATPLGEVLATMSRWADEGKYVVHVDRTFPLAEIEQAFALGREGHTRGKIIMIVGN